jgi:hypothetical protein
MAPEYIELISTVAGIAAAIAAWFSVKRIEKRLGCKDDWELIGLGLKKVGSLCQKKASPKT